MDTTPFGTRGVGHGRSYRTDRQRNSRYETTTRQYHSGGQGFIAIVRDNIRIAIAIFAILVIAGLAASRLIDLAIDNQAFLNQQSDSRSLRTEWVKARRGMILDRNGEPLAVSAPVTSVYANPSEIDTSQPNWDSLCETLSLMCTPLKQRLSHTEDKQFVYLKRHITPQLGEAIRGLDLDGVYTQQEYRRFYPHGEVTAQLLGFTGLDQNGLEGLELAYNRWLTGKDGEKEVRQDRNGRWIESGDVIKPVSQGRDLQLTIDARIQYQAYRALSDAVQSLHAISGSVVMLDVNTGEVVAMVNYPSYNPNVVEARTGAFLRNRAVTDQFEPGSVMKTFSMATVLEHESISPQTLVDTFPGSMILNGKVVRDVRNYGVIDVHTVMTKSSNVGISKLLLDLEDRALLPDTLHAFGFGLPTGSGFPGEVSGRINTVPGNDFALSTLAFGYSIAASPLQVARGYAALAAGGSLKPISFIKQKPPVHGQQVVSRDVAQMITEMLTASTEKGGTGRRAAIEGYPVAGKTGTTRKVTNGSYQSDQHVAWFAGYVPANKPRLATVVVIDEPSEDKYYGGLVAAPLFKTVNEQALRILNIAPVSRSG